MSTLQLTDSQIKSINADTTINDKEKAVEIAALIGKNTDWTNSGNLYNKYMNFITTLSSSNFGDQKNRDYFQVVYSDMVTQSMFSGEAMNLSKPYVGRVMMLGLYAYTIEAECLKAAQTVSKFTADDEAALSPRKLNKYNSVCSLTSVINDSINNMNMRMFSTEKSDSVVSHLWNYEHTSETIFVNKGNANKAFSATMTNGNLSNIANQSSKLLNLMDKGALTVKELQAVASHVKSSYPGTSLRDYLIGVGFDMSAVPKNARFVVSNQKGEYPDDDRYIQIALSVTFQRDMISVDDANVSTSERDAYKKVNISKKPVFGREIVYRSCCSDDIINFTASNGDSPIKPIPIVLYK